MSDTVVIAGAGPAGLTAALELTRRSDYRPLVLEADSQVGGISKTVQYRGNRMDLGGHRFFSKSDWVMNWWQNILPVMHTPAPEARIHLGYQGQSRNFRPSVTAAPANEGVMLVRSRLSRIYYRRRFFDYPLKLNAKTLYNLGMLEAGLLGLSYSKARVIRRYPEKTLEDFFINRFGNRLYRTFFKDYTEKVWGVPCHQIAAEWGAQRVKGLSISAALKHAVRTAMRRDSDVRQKDVETSLIEQFLYPRLGPGQMWESVAKKVSEAGGEIRLRQRVTGLRRRGYHIEAAQVVDTDTGSSQWIECKAFISTMPLSDLAEQLRPDDATVTRVARGLPYRDFMTAGLIVRRMLSGGSAVCVTGNGMPPDNWIYIQEPDVRLGRLQIFNNWSPDLVADPTTISLGLEYFCAEGDQLWRTPDQEFLSFAAAELASIGLLDRRDVIDGTVVRVSKAYPAYFGEYSQVALVRDYLDRYDNLFAIGRNGMHRYNNQDHSMLAAKAAVDCMIGGGGDKSEIWAINSDDDYHEERAPLNHAGAPIA